MSSRWSAEQILLGIFAACLVLGTIVALGLGFDLLVAPPVIDESLDFPSRLNELQPFRVALWPYDALSTVLFVVGFGALALVSGSIASLADRDRRAGILRSSIFTSGLLGVAAGLVYLGGTQVTIALQYCDCGFRAEETISQFWALSILQGASDWLSYGAVAFGAIGVALSAVILGRGLLPSSWTWISWASAGLLVLSIALHELSDPPAGDIVLAVASGLLLPAWALMLAARFGVTDPMAESPAH